MFQGQGEYYCINGCFAYPVNADGIREFALQLPETGECGQMIGYDICPEQFVYQRAMNEEYAVKSEPLSSFHEMTPISCDFDYAHISCRLQVDIFDDCYYGISVVYSMENKLPAEKQLRLKENFYTILKPMFGNDGHEKWLPSPKDMQKDDDSVFDNNFYIRKDLCSKMPASCFGATDCLTWDGGVYYPKQPKRIYQSLYRAVFDAVRDDDETVFR